MIEVLCLKVTTNCTFSAEVEYVYYGREQSGRANYDPFSLLPFGIDREVASDRWGSKAGFTTDEAPEQGVIRSEARGACEQSQHRAHAHGRQPALLLPTHTPRTGPSRETERQKATLPSERQTPKNPGGAMPGRRILCP